MSVYLIARNEGGMPIYRQIRDVLVNEITSLYKPGDCLPTENELAERFGVNRHTLRRAVDELVADGIVVRFHGKGVFILETAINYTVDSKTRFTETLTSLGHTTASRVLRKQLMPARSGVAKRLQIQEGVSVIFIETLREVDQKPFCIISHYLPADACQEVIADYDGGSLHKFIQQQCAIELKRSESLICSVLPEANDARLLNMPKHAPILRVKSINLDVYSNRPIEYAVTRFRGDVTQLSFQP